MSFFADWQKSLSDSIMALLIGPAVKWEMTKYVAVCWASHTVILKDAYQDANTHLSVSIKCAFYHTTGSLE